MPTFNCTILTRSGSKEIKRIDALTEAEAKAILNNQGEIVLLVKQARVVNVVRGKGPRMKEKASRDEVASAIRQMSILIQAGIPLVDGLRGLAEQCTSRDLSNSLEQMAAEISQGISLSASFAKHQDMFPRLASELAKVAEVGGNLAEAMARLAQHMEDVVEIRGKIRSAVAYPFVVACISFVTVIFLLTFVLPRFSKLFSSLGAQAPLATRVLLSLSHTLVTNWQVIILIVALFVFLTRRFAKTQMGKRKLDTLALRAPIIGDIICKTATERVVASMATLLYSGVPIIKALEISAAAADNTIVEDALHTASDLVSSGQSVSQALKSTGLFPSVMVQVVASGEKTGELSTMLDHVCKLYRQETNAKVKSLTAVIEPLLIVILGVVVGSIAISIMLPIYSLVDSVR